jgi:hypothetical protein
MSLAAPALRAFGRSEDLDLDLEGHGADQVVTDLLTQCSSDAASGYWWEATIGRRIAALVRIVAITERSASLAVTVACDSPGCGAPLEMAIPLEAIDSSGGAPERFPVGLANGQEVIVRPPNGADQRTWRQRHYDSREEAVAAMLESLLVEGDVSGAQPRDIDVIAEALAERDPLVAFTISYDCPSCGTSREMAIDLERLAIQRLIGVQQGLLKDVHALATRYGWTESEVLAIPAQRRARYRALIDEEFSL